VSATPSIQAGDVGTVFRLAVKDPDTELPIPIDAATTKEFIFRPPYGQEFTRQAAFNTDGSDGVLKYVGQAGDFTVPGKWRYQAHVVTPDGDWRSDVVYLDVKDNA
jgi:hypothetical protein